MKNRSPKIANPLSSQETEKLPLPVDNEPIIDSYHPPQLVILGKASKLVQSYSSGKYSDGYSGYYWER